MGLLDDPGHDINNKSLHFNVDTATKLMDKKGCQPNNCEEVPNNCCIAQRRLTRVPGQNLNGNVQMWWQSTAAADPEASSTCRAPSEDCVASTDNYHG